jgi:hypothetical protein
MRIPSEVWKGAALGVATPVASLAAYALLGFASRGAPGADRAEVVQTISFLGALLLAALLPSTLVGGLLGALARHLRKARTLKLAGAAVLGYFMVMAVTFAILGLSQEPPAAARFGVLMGVVLTPILAPFVLVAAVILERWTRDRRSTSAPR